MGLWPKEGKWFSRKSSRLGVWSPELVSPYSLSALGHSPSSLQVSFPWKNRSFEICDPFTSMSSDLSSFYSHPKRVGTISEVLGQFCPWCDHHVQQAKQVPSGKANQSSLAIHTGVTADLIVLASAPTGKPTRWSVTSWALPRGRWHQHDQIMFSKGKIMSGCVAEDTDESQYCPGGLNS